MADYSAEERKRATDALLRCGSDPASPDFEGLVVQVLEMCRAGAALQQRKWGQARRERTGR